MLSHDENRIINTLVLRQFDLVLGVSEPPYPSLNIAERHTYIHLCISDRKPFFNNASTHQWVFGFYCKMQGIHHVNLVVDNRHAGAVEERELTLEPQERVHQRYLPLVHQVRPWWSTQGNAIKKKSKRDGDGIKVHFGWGYDYYATPYTECMFRCWSEERTVFFTQECFLFW